MRRRRRSGETGMALVLAVFTMAALLLSAAGALLVGTADIHAARNFRGAAQAHFVAESGVSHALQIINRVGVVNFQADVVDGWTALFGVAPRSFQPLSGLSYTVTPFVNPATPTESGSIVSTATGPEGMRSVVVATVARSSVPVVSPGAVYLASDAHTDASFSGDAFAIDGNDHNYTGGAGPASPVPGIATRNDTNAQEAINSLSSGQKDDVRGLGFALGPPTTPSISTAPAAPSVDQMNQIINDILARPGVVTNTSDQVNGNSVFGTTDDPLITHFTAAGGVTIKGNGNASGAGILIVEGDLTIQGTFDFIGLVMVRGRTNVQADPSLTDVIGNASLYGALWTQDINLVVGGSAIIDYSSQALALANLASDATTGALPSPLRVLSLADCAQLGPGVGGCP